MRFMFHNRRALLRVSVDETLCRHNAVRYAWHAVRVCIIVCGLCLRLYRTGHRGMKPIIYASIQVEYVGWNIACIDLCHEYEFIGRV